MEDRKLPPMPKFGSEAEEAQRWFDHGEELGEDFAAAAKQNGLGPSSVARWAQQLQMHREKSSAA
jgi:hypothetical protein